MELNTGLSKLYSLKSLVLNLSENKIVNMDELGTALSELSSL